LLDAPKRIRKKLGRAVTDSQRDIVFDPERHGLFNLLGIYRALSGQQPEVIEAHFAGKGYGDLKGELADLIIAEFEPIQTKYAALTEDPSYIDNLLRDNANTLRPIVDGTMDRVRQVMGVR
jgi:tryptophanyl-tRNA synthetase